MDYKTEVFGFGSDNLIQFAESHTLERTARIEGDCLVMESETDRRILRKGELPTDGPKLETDYPLMDWAFLMARRDLESNFHEGGISAGEHFRHTPSWVRDTCITAITGLATFYPEKIAEVLPRLLDEKLGEIQFEQYRGFYEDRYYTMTDQILWVLAAEKLGKVLGDNSLLAHGAPYAAKTLSRMIEERMDSKSFLFAGGSSLFDGHSGFPDGMTGPGLRSSSVNLIYLRALKILKELEGLPEETRKEYEDLRGKLADALDRELWVEERGHYAQLRHGENYREERLETLGNLFALGNPDLPADKAQQICRAIRQHPYGVPALTPWYEERVVYHSEAVWPFMAGIGLWALRERRNNIPAVILEDSGLDLTYTTAQLLRTSMLEGTFMELLHGRTGQGRFSPAQVWSAAAMLSVVENGIFGMQFQNDHLRFRPELPDFLKGRTVTLRDFVIRGVTVTLAIDPDLNVSVNGSLLTDNILHFADWGMTLGKRNTNPIKIPADLKVNAERDTAPPTTGVTVISKDWKLCAGPAEVVIFPGEEQIGSYALTLTVCNEADQDRTLSLQFESPGEGITVQPEQLNLSVKAGETMIQTIRLRFDQPPVHFGGGVFRIHDASGTIQLELPVRRFFTLDCSWRIKPMFKVNSVNYGREFRNVDHWDMQRVPMHAEFRLGPYEGILWYAKKIIVPVTWTREELVFYCGAMSDWDKTYFNGTLIGQTGSAEASAQGKERCYTIPAELIKPGQTNTIAVQVYCSGKNSGMWKGPVFLAREGEVEWAKSVGQAVFDRNVLSAVEAGENSTN